MKKTLLLIFIMLTYVLTKAQEYIDYQIRTNNFYAYTDETGFLDLTYADPTWHFQGKVSSSSSSGSYSDWECVNSTNSDASGAYNDGEWFARPTTVRWTGKCLSNADNVYVNIEGWEEQNGTPCTHESSDNFYSTDFDYDIDLTGNHTRGVWTSFKNAQQGDVNYVDCGSTSNDNYYKIEFEVWWNWSLPVNPDFSITEITSTTATINLTSTNNYRINSWDYQVSTNASFSNVIASSTETADLTASLTGLTGSTTYYIRIRGTNEAGTGDWTSYQTITTKAAPTAADFTALSGPYQNLVYTFSTSDFSYSDATSAPLDHIRITSIPESGTLYVDSNSNDTYDSGEELSNNSTVASADLDAGNLQYYTTATTNTSFTFDVNDGGAYSASTYTATLNIIPIPTVAISLSIANMNETGGSSTLTATLSNEYGAPITTSLVFAGTATFNTDYTVSGTSIEIASGTTGSITISSISDVIDETNENVVVDIDNITNGTEDGTQQATLTIDDDDDPPAVNFTAASQSSTNESGTMTITAELSAVSGKDVTIPFSVDASSTATGNGTDYSISESPISIAAGSTNAQITITITNDAIDEDNETVVVHMGTPTNATQGSTNTHAATITDDDDAPTVSFTTASQSSINESGMMTITAELSAASGKNITIPFTVNASSTATGNGTDYSISESPVSIAAGNTTANVTISITDDAIDENDETVIVDMGTPTNATQGSIITHTATITDDDAVATISTTAATSITGNSAVLGGNITNNGGTSVTGRGVVYSSTNTSPAIGGTDVITDQNGDGIGTFTKAIGSLSPNTTYYFQAYAINNSGTAYGGVESFTTKSTQTITFEALSNKTYGDSDFAPGAITSSGLTITYSSSDASVANIVDGKIHIVGAGSCTIYADQEGDASFDAAPQVSQMLTVNKATLTATANDQTKTYGENNPALTISYSGFVGSDSETDIDTPPTASTSATALSDAGTYTITAAGGNDNNYDFSYTDGTLTVNKATLTVTADDQTKTYGDDNPTLTISYSGFVGSDSETDIDTPPTASTSATAASDAGTYSITAAGGNDNNYDFSYTDGTLAVNKATLTTTANDQTKTYGDDNPTLTISYSGFIGSDSETDIDTPPTASTSATASSGAGTYSIAAAGGNDNNYNFSYTNGTLTVNKATLTATADDQTKTYGENNPTLTISYSGFVGSDSETDIDTPPTASTSATAASNAGTYSITAAGGNDNNYDFSYTDGTLTVNKAALTVTADNKTKEYDGTVFNGFTVSYNGFVNGENETALSGSLSYSGTATTTTNVGTGYIITPGGLTSENYSISFVNGTLDITLKAQTITFETLATRVYGDIPFNLTGTSTSGLPVTYSSSNTNVATISGNIVTIVGAGTTTITASQAGNENFSPASDVTQELIISKADQILTLGALPVGDLPLKDFTDPIQVTASSSSGLPVIISLGSGSVATLNGSNQLESIGITGNVVINVDQSGNSNYNSASISYSFDVVKSNQSITFPTLSSQTYSPELTVELSEAATASSNLEVSYSVASGPGTIAGTTLTVTSAGTILLKASQSGDAVFNPATDVTQPLVIPKATPVITNFEDLTKTYDDAPFTLSASSESIGLFTYSSSNSAVATISGNTITIAEAGTTQITAVQDFDDNYTTATKTVTLMVEPNSQTITFNELTNKTYGDADFELTATANSELTVTYTSSNINVATISGSTVTIVGVGSTDITASQTGNSNYDSATPVVQTLTVNAKELTVVNSIVENKGYDGNMDAVISGATLSGIEAGDIVNLDNASAGTFAQAEAGTDIHVSTLMAISGSNANNYTLVQPTDLKADITKVPLSVTAENKTKAYDGNPYNEFTVTYSGFVNNEDKNNLSGALAFSGTASTAVSVGTGYVITPEGLTSSNYVITFVNGTLDITKKALTVTAENKTKVYDGNPYSTFSVSYDGFADGENETNLEGTLSFSGTATTATNAGNYEIVPEGLTSPNYDISFVNGSLSITPKMLAITADDKTKVYDGNTYDSFSVTYDGFADGENETNLSGTLAFRGSALQAINVGSYEINPEGLSSEDYQISFINGTLNITPKPQIITFGALADRTYGSADFNLHATASSGLDVVYNSSNTNVATVSGNTVTIVGVGLTYLTASQPGNNNYSAANNVSKSLIVRKAEQAISFDNLPNKTDQDAEFELNVSSSSGLPVTYTSSDTSVASCSGTDGSTIIIHGTGSCVIYANQPGNKNYNAAPQVEQTFTVVKYIAGDINNDGDITSPEIAGDTNEDGLITTPEISGDINGDGQITEPEIAGDIDGDGEIASPEIAGDINGDGQIDNGEIAGDTNGDGKISSPEVAGDTNGDGQIDNGEIAGDIDGNGEITSPEVAGDTDGNHQIDNTEITGDTNGNGIIDNDEVKGDTDGNGTIDVPVIAGDINGDGKINNGEIAGDTNGDGKITSPELAGDANGDGLIDNGEIAGDIDGDGIITSPEVVGDTDGNNQINGNEITGDTNGNGIIDNDEVKGDTDGNGTTDVPVIFGDINGDGQINNGEVAGDSNGNGIISDNEIAGDTNGNGQIDNGEIAGDINGDGVINNGEFEGDLNGDGQVVPTETTQTITFLPLEDKYLGDDSFIVSATGGASGNPVTFSSSDTMIATCGGDHGEIITIVGSGTCSIMANQAGNDVFSPAAEVSQLLTIAIKTSAENITSSKKLKAYAIRNTEIHIEGEISKGSLATLYDINGAAILTKRLNGETLNIISLPNIKTAIYVLRINDNGIARSFKIPVKE